MSTLPALIDDLVAANRILAGLNVLDGFGHVSVRHPDDANRYLLSRSRTPYLERFIHGEVYKVRPEVMAVVHNHSPSVIPFCCTNTSLRPIFHMSAFIGLGVPNWEIRDALPGSDMLVRDTYLGASLAKKLGGHPAALMRGHGAVVVGESLQVAVGRSVYLEQNARMQYQAELLAGPNGEITFMDDQEVAANVVWQDYGRFWNLVRNKMLKKLEAEK